jgi:hypothetical protein
MFATHGKESFKISNFVCNCFEGTHELFEEKEEERQKG